MSATFRILSGIAMMRLDGQEAEIHSPWEEAGIEYRPVGVEDFSLGSGWEEYKESVVEAMHAQLGAPAMGAADHPPRQVGAMIEVEAVGGPVFCVIYTDPTSAHPDETFAQGAEQSELLLQPGEKWTGPVCHSNAVTVYVVTG